MSRKAAQDLNIIEIDLSYQRKLVSSFTRGSEDKNYIAADAALLDSRLRGNDKLVLSMQQGPQSTG